jgi:threonine/homoserine/homoserine lactone efflux protein
LPSSEILITFTLAAILLNLSPGPSNLYVMAGSIGQGVRGGIGAVYLFFLGIQYWKSGLGEAGEPRMARVKSEVQIFKESVLVEVTNPKTALFFT